MKVLLEEHQTSELNDRLTFMQTSTSAADLKAHI